jgi:hypothetical protein
MHDAVGVVEALKGFSTIDPLMLDPIRYGCSRTR